MADYYSLLADAIARLPHSTPETRHQLYERTRQLLLTHLQNNRRPLTTADIEHQLAAFDSAFAEIEVQLAIDAALKTSSPHSGTNASPAGEETISAVPPASPPQRFQDRGVEEPEPADIPAPPKRTMRRWAGSAAVIGSRSFVIRALRGVSDGGCDVSGLMQINASNAPRM